MMPTTHDLKCDALYFDLVAAGVKRFELRRNDRGYKVGDLLRLREHQGDGYTGRECTVRVTYLLHDYYALTSGFVAMSIDKVLETQL